MRGKIITKEGNKMSDLVGYGAYEQKIAYPQETTVRLRGVLETVKHRIDILECDRDRAVGDEDFLEAGKYQFAVGEMNRLFLQLLELE